MSKSYSPQMHDSDDNEQKKVLDSAYFDKQRNHLKEIKEQMDLTLEDMDQKLVGVIRSHEQDYLKGYAIFVREKERELKELVIKLNNRANVSGMKDQVIAML